MSAQEQNSDQRSDQRSESIGESITKAAETVVREAAAGREELVAGIKKAIDVLKAGGRSGITNEFGKPQILEDLASAKTSPEASKVVEQVSQTFKGGEIQAVKSFITGELGIPTSIKQIIDKATTTGQGDKVASGINSLPQMDILERAGENHSVDPVRLGGRGPASEQGVAESAVSQIARQAMDMKIPDSIKDLTSRIPDVFPHTGDAQSKPADGGSQATRGADGPAQSDATRVSPKGGDDKFEPSSVTFDHSAVKRAESPAQQQQDATAPTGDGKNRSPEHVVRMEPITITASPDIAYRGEVINRDVQPEHHTVRAGESLSRIAREHLGPGATPEEIQKHVQEIARVNHISNPNSIRAGQELTLPGHTADGAFVSRDHAGATLTRWQDGTERVENSDHTGFVRRPAADGGYSEHHWGPQPENNYEVTRTADGKLQFADHPGDQPREYYDTQQVHDRRQKLNDLAESRITNPQELAQFRANMAEFEARAHRQGMPPEEVAKTYEQMSRLLESRGDQPVSQKDRVMLAEQVMDQAAHPTSIDQGQHNTCNVTTVESRLYTRNPSEAARLVTDMATTGQFTTRDGQTTVTMPPGSFSRDSEAQGHPPGYGDRSYASQIFQVTAINLHHQTTPYSYTDAAGVQHNVPAGGMRYEQIPNPTPPDTGERLYDTTTNPRTLVKNEPDITDDGIVRVNNRLTGDTGNGVMIDHSEYVYGNASGVTTVSSEKDLNDRIREAAEAKPPKLPLIIGVHTGNEPFLHDSGGGAAGGSGGGHVITVTGYEAGPPARVHVDNQWGEGVDYQGNRSMSVHDLYLTMRPPDNANQIRDLQRDVDWDRAHNTIDTRKEFELLRLRHNLPATDSNRLSDAEFGRQMREQIDAAALRWDQQRRDGTFNQAEHDNAMQKLNDMITNKPAEQGLLMVERMHKNHLITDQEYDQDLSRVIRDTRARYAAENATNPPSGNAAERQRARAELQRLLNELPDDRRQAVLNNSR